MYSKIHTKIESYCHPGSTSPVLQDVDLLIEGGIITGLLGLSGSGKTTLMNVILGTAPGQLKGETSYNLRNTKLSASEAQLNGHVGVLLQGTPLVPWLNVQGNLLLPSRLNPKLKTPSTEEITVCLQSLNLGSEKLLQRYPHQLSLGEKFRAVFSRLVLYSPSFLLMDEMFNGLDSANADDIASNISKYVLNEKSACLMITHDLDRALSLSDRIYYLTPNGRIEQLSSSISRKELMKLMKNDLAVQTTT